MPLQLRPARVEDGPAMGAIGTRAFRDGLNRVLFPPHLQTPTSDDEGSAWRKARTLRRMREGRVTFVVVDLVDGQETVIAYAQWERPQISDQPQKQEEPATEDGTAASLDKGALARLNRILDQMAQTALGPDGYKSMWYLLIVSVDPDHQRKGAGRMLVRWGMEQAAAEGRKVFLVATPEGKSLYEALGFQVIGDPVDFLGFPNYSMLWEAAAN